MEDIQTQLKINTILSERHLRKANQSYKNKDYDEAKQYYLMAIEKGNTNAMNNLAYYFGYIEKDYEQMKHYYIIAIDKDNTDAMNNLGHYYKDIKDYDKMKHYYMMATNKGNSDAMNNLGFYYYDIEKKYKKAVKYFEMALKFGNPHNLNYYQSMNNLGCYYFNTKDYKRMKHYYLMAIDKGNICAMKNLSIYYKLIENDEILSNKYLNMYNDKNSL